MFARVVEPYAHLIFIADYLERSIVNSYIILDYYSNRINSILQILIFLPVEKK